MNRQLSDFERILLASDQACCSNLVMVARVAGPLSDNVLGSALRRAQAQHPLLLARIEAEPDGSDPRFASAGTAAIPLRTQAHVRGRFEDTGWHKQAEHEMNTRFDTAVGPLARVVAVHPDRAEGEEPGVDEETDLLITLHRVVADPVAGMHLLDDVLHAAARVVDEAGSGAPREPTPERPPVDSFVPRSAKAAKGSWLKRPSKLAADASVPLTERRTRLVHRLMRPEDLSRLEDRCRAERTSLRAAVCAAFARSLTRDIAERSGKKSPTVAFGSTVDLREHLQVAGTALAGEMGFFQSTTCTTVRPFEAESLWSLAREVEEQLSAAIERGEPWGAVQQQAKLSPSRGKPMPGDRLGQQLEKLSPANAVICAPELPGIDGHGPFMVRKRHFCCTPSLSECALGAIATYRGWLTWNLLHSDGIVKHERAEKLVDRSLDALALAAKLP